jgi:[ribosomal protein S5]-alanine N-acetyltransferase
VSAQAELYIVTPRTFIVRTPTEAIARRLGVDDFFADVDLGPAAEADGGDRVASVHFPPAWPGDALAGFPAWLERRRAADADPWVGTVVERATLDAIGQMGCRALPDADGRVEIRYATNQDRRDRGVATEAGGAFVAWLLGRPEVAVVVAECLVTNVASVRVLEKVGFALVEEREDAEGRLLRWEKRSARANA